MKSFKDKYVEYLSTTSTMSSMRLAFFWIIRAAICLSFLIVICAAVLGYFEKSFDIGACVALTIGMLTTAFGGKAGQSFAEKDTPISGSV